MNRFNQHTPFKFTEFTKTVWDIPPHNHNHFEIIHIIKGTGEHIINNMHFPYKENAIFLIAPNDIHSFNITTTTKFCYIKFTESLFEKNTITHSNHKWIKKIESILFQPNLLPSEMTYNDYDTKKIISLLDIIIQEQTQKLNYGNEIIEDCVSIILSIIARNISQNYYSKHILTSIENNKITQILSYIRQYVYNQSKMRIDSIAQAHNMSKNYISIYFKKNMGISLQKYIIEYRLKLAKNRIKLSDYTISEIAFELGFSDESHLIKQYKNTYGLTPGEYRKQLSKK